MFRPVGTIVQHKNGYIHVKVEKDGEEVWQAQGRRMWELQRGELADGDRVFHIDGDRTNNRIGNLAKVHFNSTKFIFLKRSKVLYQPGVKSKKENEPNESAASSRKRRAFGLARAR